MRGIRPQLRHENPNRRSLLQEERFELSFPLLGAYYRCTILAYKGSDRLELSKITFIHFLEEVAHDTNSVLFPETIYQLNIYLWLLVIYTISSHICLASAEHRVYPAVFLTEITVEWWTNHTNVSITNKAYGEGLWDLHSLRWSFTSLDFQPSYLPHYRSGLRSLLFILTSLPSSSATISYLAYFTCRRKYLLWDGWTPLAWVAWG